MKDSILELQRLELQLKSDSLATYFVGKYYFSINTRKDRLEFGLADHEPITIEVQKKMQLGNIISIFHEYIHYIHEISTVIGNVGLGLDIYLKSIFSNYFDSKLESALHHGIDKTDSERFAFFCKIFATKEVINGSVIQEGQLLRIKSIRYRSEKLYVPNESTLHDFQIEAPIIDIVSHAKGKLPSQNIVFGKFFLYEGLAYELDRIIHKHQHNLSGIQDNLKNTEYTVLRNVAKFIIPTIDTYTFLCVASLSLSYINCGYMFISMLERIKNQKDNGISVADVLNNLKNEVSILLFSKQSDFNNAQDEISKVFEKRKQLHIAFCAIAKDAKNGYLARCEKPTFEIDLIFNNDYISLLKVIPICDYMYVFNDDKEFERDFLGSSSYDSKTSHALKVLIGYDHYQKSHELDNTPQVELSKGCKCPFYSCCNLQLRLNYAEICGTKPWRIFEISSKLDKQFCWYGQAVGEFKGHNEK